METIVCRVEEGPGQRFLEARVAVVGEDLVVAVGEVVGMDCHAHNDEARWPDPCATE